MITRLPSKQTQRWDGPYLGNYYGSLWKTFNIDLENSPGHITLSKSFVNVGDTTDTNLLHLGTIDAFLRSDADCTDRWWALSRRGRLIKTDSTNGSFLPTATWDEDTLANSPTDARDMTIHENDSKSDCKDTSIGRNRLYVTRDTAVASLNDTGDKAWNLNFAFHTSPTALKSGVPHPIEYFPYQRITLIGDGNLVHTIDKNKNVTYARLTLPTYLETWAIFTTVSRAWILCLGKMGKNGAIVEWDGYSQSCNYIHDAQASIPLSGVDYYGTPIVVNNRGAVLEYNGNSFYPMVRNGQQICFPFYEDNQNTFYTPIFSSNQYGAIAARGMTVSDDGLIYINTQGPFYPSQRTAGGIYCLNPKSGSFYAKYSLNMGSDTDYGQQGPSDVGAIKSILPESASSINSYLLSGGQVFTSWSSGGQLVYVNAIWALHRTYSSTARRGYFITQYIHAEEIQETWDNIWLELSALKSTADVIVVKARGCNPLLDVNRRPLTGSITWTSTTTFTVTLNAGDDSLSNGDEVEITHGKNGGVLAHITNIVGNHGAQQTITIDETVANGSGSSHGRFDRWKKLGTITSLTKYFVPLNIRIDSSFVQFKVELRGAPTDFEVKNLVVSSTKQTITKK